MEITVFKHLYRLPSCYGVSYTKEQDAVRWDYCRLILEKDGINLQDAASAGAWTEVAAKLDKKLPIALQISGKQVLIKQLPSTADIGVAEIMDVFPNYSPETFYHAVHHGQTCSWLALVRTDIVDRLLSDIEASGSTVVQVYLGPFVYANILDQINKYNGSYVFDGHSITIDQTDGKWTSYTYGRDLIDQFTTKIGTQVIDQRHLGAYAAGFSCMMHDYMEDDHSLQVASLQTNYTELREKIKFNKNAMLLVAILFALLAINAVVFSYYYGSNQELDSQVTAHQSTATDINKLQQRLELQEHKITALGWNGGVQQSWLLDQIGQSLREFTAIAITEIAINPALKTAPGATAVSTQRIRVKGSCVSLSQLNAWVRQLERKGWIEKVSIEQFGAAQDQEQTNPLFTIQIIFNAYVE